MLNLNEPPPRVEKQNKQERSQFYVALEKDKKPICRTRPNDLPFNPGTLIWQISKFCPVEQYGKSDFPQFQLYPEPLNYQQDKEWPKFMKFLHDYKKVALVSLAGYELYIRAPDASFSHAVVMYHIQTPPFVPNTPINLPVPIPPASNGNITGVLEVTGDNVELLRREGDTSAPLSSGGITNVPKVPLMDKNFSCTHPTYLKTLGQTHASWIFGAIAELVDNSRDANSKRIELALKMMHIQFGPINRTHVTHGLDINIESLYSKNEGKLIPVLSVIDDGHGMSHQEIMTMIAFGHSLPKDQQSDHIGRFGIGFKTGSMRLGKDAIVLTQTETSRSVALLSQSFNENKPNLEIPVVSYRKHNNYMELDLSIQSKDSGENYLNAIKDFSPFNEYFLGEKLGLFGANGTGTQIYIWNLDKWGQNYSLEWDNKDHDGDILIRSRRVRSRLGQLSQKVPLDYSLRAYMEAIFLTPRMRIYIQGSLVKARPLAKTLNKTSTVNGMVMGKPLQLTLGISKTEMERVNCGIFLYWHGRLIEAYKRVGTQVHHSDITRGVIGVVDITNLMDDDDGKSWVMNNKQGFQDCEIYVKLEEWLGEMTDRYWDTKFDKLELKKGSGVYSPDHQWVQCDKCRKWRVLDSDYDINSLSGEWFCFMPPYLGRCEDPEKQVGRDVITISAKRSGYGKEIAPEYHCSPPVSLGKRAQRTTVSTSKRHSPDSRSSNTTETSHGGTNVISIDEDEDFSITSENIEETPRTRTLKRLRRGVQRGSKY